MYNFIRKYGILGCSFFILFTANGQERKVREADQFWKKRIVHRISLIEKINQPLVHHASSYYTDDSPYPQTQGIVVSLINGVQEGKYKAYHPDNWRKSMTYPELLSRIKEFERAYLIEDQYSDNEAYSDDNFDNNDLFDEFGNDDFGSKTDDPIDTLGFSDEDWPFEDWRDLNPTDNTNLPKINSTEDDESIDYGPYEQVFHIIEDWIFDKGTSETVHETLFFEVIWRDVGGTLPERVLARFKWEDVKGQLDQTAWKNRFNDGQTRSMREIIALRRFNSIMINVGGQPIRTLHEAIRRKQELVEFEHHLWSY